MKTNFWMIVCGIIFIIFISGCNQQIDTAKSCDNRSGSTLCGYCATTSQCTYCFGEATCSDNPCNACIPYTPTKDKLLIITDFGEDSGTIKKTTSGTLDTKDLPTTVIEARASALSVYSFDSELTDAKPRFSIASGTIPPGMTIDPNGILQGEPTAVGTYNFVVCMDYLDGTPNLCSPINFIIKPKTSDVPSTHVVKTLPLSELFGKVGNSFTHSFAEEMKPTGGNPPYTFFLGSGIGFPPLGLALYTTGELSGTPSAESKSKFQICVKDIGGDYDCQITTMTVGPAENANVPPIVPTEPVPSDADSKAQVTISDGTCVISGLYEGGNPAAKREGWRFARYYKVTVSGTVSGPVGTTFMFRPTPVLPNARTPTEFSCGSWYKSEYVRNCERMEGSTEATQWSHSVETYGEVLNNLNDVNNIQVEITVTAGKGYSELYEGKGDTKTLVIKCPLVTY